jgi:hypothetical protein
MAFPSRKTIVKVVVISTFITGAILIGVGSSGVAMPIVMAGVVLLMAGGIGGFAVVMDHPTPSLRRPITSQPAQFAAGEPVVV